MATLMVDGVPIAEIDTDTARILRRLAGKQLGSLLRPLEVARGQFRDCDLGVLARGSLVRREHRQDCDVLFSLRFSEKSESIERAYGTLSPTSSHRERV